MFDLKAFREQKIPTQDEIILQWETEIYSKSIVSIVCTSFNQESYIEDAFKGFLTQKTNFPFEIIIHDDASSDNTVNIIKKYVEQYPLIIKPILQKENQYSKSPNSVLLIAFEAVNSEFIALCEGDDFWIDENKLQCQYNALLKYPEIKICFTAAFGLYADGTTKNIANYSSTEKIIRTSEVIRGGGGFMPTASLFIRRVSIMNLPSWFSSAPVGDYYIQTIASMDSGALYLHLNSCCYRLSALGSWSRSNTNVDKLINFMAEYNASLNKLAASYGKYRFDFIYTIIKMNIITPLVLLRDKKTISFIRYICFLFFGRKVSIYKCR